MTDIIITRRAEGTFDVASGGRKATELTWEEMCGLVAQMTMPEGRPSLGWLRTAEQQAAWDAQFGPRPSWWTLSLALELLERLNDRFPGYEVRMIPSKETVRVEVGKEAYRLSGYTPSDRVVKWFEERIFGESNLKTAPELSDRILAALRERFPGQDVHVTQDHPQWIIARVGAHRFSTFVLGSEVAHEVISRVMEYFTRPVAPAGSEFEGVLTPTGGTGDAIRWRGAGRWVREQEERGAGDDYLVTGAPGTASEDPLTGV